MGVPERAWFRLHLRPGKVHDVQAMADTPLKQARIRRNMSTKEVASFVGCDPSTLYRLENDPRQRAKESLARALYVFYRGELDYIDILDPTFLDEVGIIERPPSGSLMGFRIKVRTGSHRCQGVDQLRKLLKKLGILAVWDGFTL